MKDFPAVLYVEDDPMSRMVVEIILTEQMGLTQVAIFDDSSDFEAKIDMLPFVPHVILLDIHMKPITGFEMLNILREHPRYRNLPIVALTASVMNEEVDQLRNAGFDSVLSKPLNELAFHQTLQRLLQGEKIWSIS